MKSYLYDIQYDITHQGIIYRINTQYWAGGCGSSFMFFYLK